MNDYESLIQLNKLCLIFLGVAVICCVVGLIIIWFVLLRGKAKLKVNDKEIIIGDMKDKEELHREILELKKIVKKLENAKK